MTPPNTATPPVILTQVCIELLLNTAGLPSTEALCRTERRCCAIILTVPSRLISLDGKANCVRLYVVSDGSGFQGY